MVEPIDALIASRQSPTTASQKKIRILAVDDDAVNRLFLAKLLQQEGYDPMVAASGEQAIELFQTKGADLILMDVVMPGIGGFEAARRIKQLNGHRWIPIFFVSAQDEGSQSQEWADSGDQYLHKPLDVRILRSRLKSTIMAIRLQQEIDAAYSDTRALAQELLKEQALAAHLFERLCIRQPNDLTDRVRVWHRSSARLSGDMVLIEQGPRGRIYAFSADATGHGLAAAVSLLPAVQIFMTMARKGFEPGTIAREINHKLWTLLPRDYLIAASLLMVDTHGQTLHLWNGGQPAAVLLDDAGQVKAQFHARHPPLGVLEDGEFAEESATAAWCEGDTFLCCSNGLLSALTGEDPKPAALATCLADCRDTDPASFLWQAFEARPILDDASLLAIALHAEVAETPSPPTVTADALPLLAGLSFGPEILRHSDLNGLIQSSLRAWGLQAIAEDPKFQFALTEMLVNALDHGLLNLDSAMKQEENGWEKYYGARDERIQTLDRGTIELRIHGHLATGLLRIEVQDTGKGFDFRKEQMADAAETRAVGSGRGLTLLRHLCETVAHEDEGRRIVVMLQLGKLDGPH